MAIFLDSIRNKCLELVLAEQRHSSLFIYFCLYSREQPSKLDSDVLAAIEAAEIDPQKYPIIYRWRHAVQSYSSSDRQRYFCKFNQMH